MATAAASAAAYRSGLAEREQQSISPKMAAAQGGGSFSAGGGGGAAALREPRVSSRASRLTNSRRVTAGSTVAASESGRGILRGPAALRAATERELYDEEGNRVTPRSLLPKSQQEAAGLGGGPGQQALLSQHHHQMQMNRGERISTNSNISYSSNHYFARKAAAGGGGAGAGDGDDGPGLEMSDHSTNDASHRPSRMSSTASISMMSADSSSDDVGGGEEGLIPPDFEWPDDMGKDPGEEGDASHQQELATGEANNEAAAAEQALEAGGQSKERASVSAAADLMDKDLDADVVVALSETETAWLLEIPSRCVSNEDAAMVAVVTALNSAHEAAVVRSQEATELFTDAHVQTANLALKCKETSLPPPPRMTRGCLANNWTIYQALSAEQVDAASGPDDIVTSGKAIGNDGNSGGGGDSCNTTNASSLDERMADLLQLCECSLLQNKYFAKLVSYKAITIPPRLQGVVKNHDECTDQEGEGGKGHSEGLQWLWTFDARGYNCDFSSHGSGRGSSSCKSKSSVTALAWSSEAVGVAAVGFSSDKTGAIATMSLRSPEWPVRMIWRPAPVTALDFCPAKPHLLAVGGGDGVVSVFNLSKKDTNCQLLVEATTATGKHSDPVYQVHWISPALGGVGGSVNGAGSFVSISTDGRVTVWSLSKGLERIDLIQLVTPTMNTGSTSDTSSQEGLVSRLSGGMCFDFSPRDPSAYLAGTEDGWVHLCSVGYSEQYLDSVRAHNGPVYRVVYSPFCSTNDSSGSSSSNSSSVNAANANAHSASSNNANGSTTGVGSTGVKHPFFLTASADWTVKLWRQGWHTPIFSCQPAACAVNDCAWSPTSATCFAAVTEDGSLQLWDVSYSTVLPKFEWKTPTNQSQGPEALTRVMFSSEHPILIVGSSLGRVHVFRLNTEEDRSGPLNAATEIDKLEHFTKSAAVSVV